MKAKFKVGDKVRILDGSNIPNYNNGWVYEMKSKVGDIVTIRQVNEDTSYYGAPGYRMNECTIIWDERGLELVEDNNQIVINRYDNKVVAKLGKKVGVARCCPDDEFDLYTGSKLALDRLFGKEDKEVKEVHRTAKVGEWIKIVNASCTYGKYSNDDILLVDECVNDYVLIKGIAVGILTKEYVVLENYIPPKKDEKIQSYNGKIVCVENNKTFFTIGKIYDVKNGKFQGDNVDTWSNDGNLFRCLDQINEYFANLITCHAKFIELVEK